MKGVSTMLHFTFIKKVGTLVCGACLLFPLSGLAKELEYPIPCYKGEELAKVRAWEKTWVGKKISSANVDEVKEFLPENSYTLMKNTDRWGESWFTIVSYREVPPTPGNIKFTKQYYGQSKIGPNGELLNYISGVPFPDTTDGTEMAHNFRTRSFGDAYYSEDSGYIVDGRLKYDMNILINNNMCFFAARTDTPPAPEFPKNPKQIWRAFQMLQLDPPEVRNMRIMEIHYKDRTKPYDSWFWMPQIRRVRRRSTTERQDPKGGGDNTAFDNLGWDGPVRDNKYKYLGTKEFLLIRHLDKTKLEHTPGDCIFNGTQRERSKAHMIEVVNDDPNFFYSKMTWYLDPESWQILYSDRYDRRGKLWKVLDQYGYVGKGYDGIDIGHFCGNQMVDVQRVHSTIAVSTQDFGKQFDRRMFTLQYLQKHGY